MNSSDKRFCVYLHISNDTNTVFYLGHGTKARSKVVSRRPKDWCKEADRSGYRIEYLLEDVSKSEAEQLENKLLENPDLSWKLVNKVKARKVIPISYDYLSQYFLIDESSPSGLTWKINHRGNLGKIAGCLSEKTGYWSTRLNNIQYKTHRIVYCLHTQCDLSPELLIDHIDRNKSNNKQSNLRATTSQHNSQNRSISKRNTTGTPGIKFHINGGYEYFTAYWQESGKHKQKHFSIKKFGKEGAFQLALNLRKEMEKLHHEGIINE